jgi:hypothetical protein
MSRTATSPAISHGAHAVTVCARVFSLLAVSVHHAQGAGHGEWDGGRIGRPWTLWALFAFASCML